MKLALLALGLLVQAPLSFAPDNGKLREIDYQPNRVTTIEAAPGYQVSVLLAADEQIKSIAVGDSSSWQVSANNTGNHIFIKLSGIGQTTNMTVVTNVRLYTFELVPLNGLSSDMPYIVRFNYPSAGIADETFNPGEVLGTYRVTGTKSLWPSGIVDDGRRTFIEWPESADIPAVYALDQAGREILVNSMMRDDRLVIETVFSNLIFRIDKKVARAARREVEQQP